MSRFPIAALCCLLLCGLASSARAATRTVTTLSDITNAGDGVLTLREAIAASIANDSINFGVSGTIGLTGELAIGRSLSITGPASGIVISGNNASRVLRIDAGTVKIANLSLINGRVTGAVGAKGVTGAVDGGPGGDIQGGGLLNVGGIVTLSNCTLSNNFAVGGLGGATADSGSGAFKGGAGGAGIGGGIFNGGTLTMVNCTLSGNEARGGAGPAALGTGGAGGDGQGGGIATTGPLALVNCTLSVNFARGGNGGSSSNNGGNGGSAFGAGLELSGSGSTRNSIIAANEAIDGAGGDGGNVADGAAGVAFAPDVATGTTIQSLGHNLIGVVDGNSGGWIASDLLGGATPATRLDPRLVPLRDAGGPTFTMPLLPGSAAINAGDDVVLGAPLNLTRDQRGLARKLGSHVDIGAFEFDAPSGSTTLVVNTTDEHDDSVCGTLDCTFREALIASNANADANVINFKAGLSGTILNTLLPDALDIFNAVTINGPGARVLTISGGGVSSIFKVNAGANATISGLTIANAKNGAISNFGSLTLLRCAVSKNVGGSGAGAVNSGVLYVTNCTVSGNLSTGHGAAIRNVGTTYLTNSTFWDNSGVNSGAITSSGTPANPANISLDNCTVTSNVASDTSGGTGGGLFNWHDSSFSLHNTLIAGNSAVNGTDIAGVFISGDYNLVQSFNAAYASFSGPVVKSIFNQPAGLAAGLQNNGGPTDTIPLASNSPAINKGGGTQPTADQRGFPRVGALDIGAFEFGSKAPNARPHNDKLESSAPIANKVGQARLFRATYSDPDGYANIRYVYLQVKTGSTGVLRVAYDVATAKLYILGNDGKYAGGFKPGSAHTLSSSTGLFSCQATKVRALNTSTMQVDWVIAANAPLIGTQPVLLYVTDKGGLSDGFDQGATWQIASN